MKTLSFHELKIGRGSRSLLELDSARDELSLGPGLHLIVAPNGYGKTSFLQTLGGILKPLGGEAKWDGRRLSAESDVLYISGYLTFPKFIYPMEWIEFVGERAEAAALGKWIQGFALEKKMESFLGRMSQGERRKVTWLGAQASAKPIPLLDEPLDGLDLLAIRTARDLLKEWVSAGRTVFVVAHQVGEVLDLATEVLLIRERRLERWQFAQGGPFQSLTPEQFRAKTLDFYTR